ncbi:ATPase family AAA domain-containing protein 3 [Taenia crassiceps]|uniref:ATPase family AAA domain-containing protein 3 n=1 Tax=Taenia crassiceps TaxID=6207 RepID=A0ABR4QHJ4_9CEST
MSWLFGHSRQQVSDLKGGDGTSTPPPPPPPPSRKDDKKNLEEAISGFRFDSAALERAAKAARELEKYAKEAFELSRMNEHTQQLEYQAKLKEYELGIEQMKGQQIRIQQEERRKTLDEEAKIHKHRVDYQDMLARKQTIEYEADLRHQNELKQIEARLRGEAQIERENRDIRLERSRIEAREYRETILQSIQTAGLQRLSVLRLFWPVAFMSFRKAFSRPGDPLRNIILEPGLEAHLRKVALATRHTKANGGFYRNVLMAGPPGTGKTMMAKSLATHSGLDYAIMTGGDIAPLGSDGVTAIHKVFNWAKTSRKGVLLFVDEADAFLRKRGQERISEGMRATLNAFLYRTGEQSQKFMLVLASNQPEQFDWAINDRMDEIVYFDLPMQRERERMIRQYFDLYLLQPSMDRRQRIRLADEIDYTAKCKEVAARTEGLSGRELSKVAIAWQTAAFSSEDGTLNEEMMDNVVENAVAANKKKQEWRQHRPPDWQMEHL